MITKPVMFGAPGCYGSALTFREDLVECRNCNFNNTCGTISAERLVRLRDILGVEAIGSKKAKLPVRNISKARLDGALPKQTQAIIDMIDRSRIRVAESLIAGKNPFEKPKFMRILCHLLIAFEAGFGKPVLRQVLERKLNCTETVAKLYTDHGLRALMEIGVVVEANELFKIRR